MCKLFDWNQESYSQLTLMLTEKHKACFVLGTCLGKTTTALAYLEDNNYKGLILCPNNTIVDNWKETGVDAITYQSFILKDRYKEIDYSKYDILICDEVHHTGAEKWSKGIKYILDNDILPVLGLTATNVRSDFIDVAESLFEGNVVYGLDVLNAIRQNILNGITYINSYFDLEGIKKEYENLGNEFLLKKLNLELNNTPTVKEILKNNRPLTSTKKIKAIVFTSNLDDMHLAENIIKDVYPTIECRKIHSRLDDNAENRQWFKTTPEGIIITVNMINEGSHYEGVNTLIMFRRISSSLLYYQQIGRVMSLVSKGNPDAIIFDFVNNNKTVGLINSLTSNEKIRNKILNQKPLSKEDKEELLGEIPEQIIINDYTTSLDSVLEDINAYQHGYWSDNELDLLYKYYSIEGRKICDRIPYRSFGAINNKACSLGLYYDDPRYKWSESEMNILLENFKEKGITGVGKLLGWSKSRCLINRKAQELNLIYDPTDPWSKEEIDILNNNFAIKGATGIKPLLPNKSIGEIRAKASELKLKKTGKRILCLTNGIIYKSLDEAASLFENKEEAKGRIRGCVNGIQKHYKNYQFCYVED